MFKVHVPSIFTDTATQSLSQLTDSPVNDQMVKVSHFFQMINVILLDRV